MKKVNPSIKTGSEFDTTNKEALKLITELGLSDKQQIDEDDLETVTKALYPEDYQTKLEALLNSEYVRTVYIINLH